MHTFILAITYDAVGCGIQQSWCEYVTYLAHCDDQRGGETVLTGVAEGAVGDDLRRTFQIGVRHDQQRFFGPALGQNALAIGRSPAVDVV